MSWKTLGIFFGQCRFWNTGTSIFPASGGEAFLETYSAQLVRDYFQTGLERFLGIRFNARRSNISSKPGHFFTVRTNTHGLTVVYGGANYLRARPFQAPTSPVSQWIQPGGWIFGVASSGPNPQWDPRLLQYNVPPDKMARLPL
jgi:hypothetical protein